MGVFGNTFGNTLGGQQAAMLKQVKASDYGFSPSSSATVNTTAFNSIGPNVVVNIDVPGVYEISNTLWLESNTQYKFVTGCTIKKNISGGDFCHVLSNKGAQTSTRNNNIKLYGNGLVIDINGSNSADNGILFMRGNLNFFKVDNFVFDNIYSNNSAATNQFFLGIVDCSYGIISGFNITSVKDGIDLVGKNSNITLLNNTTNTGDDGIFIGPGYGTATPILGQNENISIIGHRWTARVTSAGYGIRFCTSSWSDYQNAQTYIWNESCISSGKIYTKTTSGSHVSSIAPVHSSGIVTGADGIAWKYIQDGTIRGAGVNNVTMSNCFNEDNRVWCTFLNTAVTLGSEGQGIIDNILIDNISQPTTYTKWLFYFKAQIGVLEIKNISISDSGVSGFGGFAVLGIEQGKVKINNLKFTNCNITPVTPNSSLFFFSPFAAGDFVLTKCTFTDCIIVDSTAYLLPTYNGTQDYYFVRTKFTGIDGLAQFIAGKISTATYTLTNCEFISPIKYILGNVQPNITANYISTGTKYVTPTQQLFFNNQASSSLLVNISNSLGSITAAKFRNGTLVTVVASDLPYV